MAPELDKRSRAYLIFRLVVVLTGFALVASYQIGLGPVVGELTIGYLYAVLGAYLAFALSLVLLYPRWKRNAAVAQGQLLIDLAAQALLTWGTGGVLSIFTPLLFVTLVATTTLVSWRFAFALASVATGLVAATTVSGALGISPFASPDGFDRFSKGINGYYLFSYLTCSSVALFAITALGSRYSQGLRNVQGMHSEILENMAEGLVAVDRKGAVVQLNREARRLLGLPMTPAARRLTLESVFPLPSHGDVHRAFGVSARRRLTTAIEGPDGRERPIEVKISSVNGDDSRPRYRIALMADLTLKREIEAAERRIQKLEDLQVMALGIAHEIRNPLASIRGCVQEIGKAAGDRPETAAYARIVCRESDRLDDLLEEFLRYARTGPVDLVPTDLTEVVQDAVTLLKSRPDLGGRRVSIDGAARGHRIFGDRDALVQVFLNLGRNALEATDPEHGEVVFRVSEAACPPGVTSGRGLAGDGTGVEVEVRDNGAGISAADRDHVFTPFFSTKPAGNGLGLCIVERIVRDHMGGVGFASDEGRGASFRVWLPAMREHASGPGTGEATDAPAREVLVEEVRT